MRSLPVESASEATAPHQPSNVRQRCRAFQGAPKPWTNLCASCLSIPRWNDWHLMRVEAEAQRKEAWKKRQAEMKNSQCFTAHNIQSCGQTALRHGLGVWPLCVMATTFGSFWRHSWFVFKTQKGQWLCVCVCSLKAGWVWMGILLFGKEGDSKYLFIQINVSPPLRLKHELKRELTGPMTAERENLAHIRCRFVRTQRVGIR